MKAPNWLRKWFKQPFSIQTLIFHYAVYIALIVASTLFVYIRLNTL